MNFEAPEKYREKALLKQKCADLKGLLLSL